MPPEKLPMRPEGRDQTFVVQDERNLHRGKTNKESRHYATADRQIIEHAGDIPEIGDEKRKTKEESCREDDEAKPLHDKAEPSHREPEQFTLAEMHALNPGEGHGNQINLKVNGAEIFKSEGHGIDCRRGLQEMRRGEEIGATREAPIDERLKQGSERAE